MITITHIDTACVLIEISGYRILTDPTLDRAGKLYYHGAGAFSTKTENPAVPVKDLPAVDLVLLSHHQHKDNFDDTGKKFTASVPLVLSTKRAAKALSNAKGLDDWERHEIKTPKVPGLAITATPAQHHPWWVPEFISGKVIGFILTYDNQANGALYISGDTVYFDGIPEIAKRYKVDIGIFHAGSVQFRYLTGYGQYTMDSTGLLKAVRVINPNTIIPIHYKGWSHFKEKETTFKNHLSAHDSINEKVVFLKPGVPVSLQ